MRNLRCACVIIHPMKKKLDSTNESFWRLYDVATTDYYDKLTAAQIEEEAEWGRLGAASLADLDEPAIPQ